MSILTKNIVAWKSMYDTIVHHSAEWIPAVTQVWTRTRGHEPSTSDWLHIYIRCMSEERQRWQTTLNALELNGVVPDDIDDVPPTHPPPLEPGRTHRIRGPFRPRKYAYWPDTWVHPTDGSTHVFAGRDDGPRFYRIDPSGAIADIGPLVKYPGETEGWYWDANGWIYLVSGDRLVHINPFTQEEETVMRAPDGYVLDQAHSSDDGRSHSATIKDASNWRKVGTLFQYHGRTLNPVWAMGDLDESMITACGRYGLIQESHNNRVFDFEMGEEHLIADVERAVAHCAAGHGFVIGEADKPDPGACVLWNFHDWSYDIIFPTLMMGHVSVQNGRCLVSHAATRQLGWIDLSTYAVLPIPFPDVPDWDPLVYDRQVRASLSPCGRRICYMSGGDLFVMEV
jgi:hypothetical protein